MMVDAAAEALKEDLVIEIAGVENVSWMKRTTYSCANSIKTTAMGVAFETHICPKCSS